MARQIIVVDNVGKDFKLPHQKTRSIKNLFTNIFSLGNQSYEMQHALKNISFEINEGEFFGIVGRNGSGKSTLLKILSGIYQPTKGKVSIGGRVVPFIELGVGFNGELTGRENVYLNGALLGFSEKEIDAKYREIVNFAELERFMDQKLKNYSSGMQVRLAFSVATRLAESDILLIDEVLAVGDADFQRKCFRYFKQLKKDNKTVVFVTHDMNAVREYCDRAALIEQSEMHAIGSPDKIAKMYECLLSPKGSASGGHDEANRWGDGRLKVESVLIVRDDKEIVLKNNITAVADCEDPVVGFVLRNGSGTALLGTNTMLLHAKMTPLKAGDEVKLTWRFPDVLPDGDYTVAFAAQYDNGMTTADWWDDACSLRVGKPQHTPYIVDPGIRVTIK